MGKKKKNEDKHLMMLGVAALLLLFTSLQISSLSSMMSGGSSSKFSFKGGNMDLSEVNVEEIQSTAQGIALLFPVGDIKTPEDAISVMIPTGTPEYGEAMGGVSFDAPVPALDYMAKELYPRINADMKANDPEGYQRFINLASNPRGVSCEFCCGIGPTGASKDGKSRCGCQHNPASLALTLWLIGNTDYSDAEILKEVYKWKTIWFPKNMVGLASQIAGGDTSVLHELPGMVGGC